MEIPFEKFQGKHFYSHQIQALKFAQVSTRRVVAINSPVGCHTKGQGILMFDGSIKKVEDVELGDSLMGPDSQPRIVKQIIRGFGKMYKIIPNKGREFIVNGQHVLTLKRTFTSKNHDYDSSLGGIIKDVPVLEYLQWSHTQQSLFKLVRVGVQFSYSQRLPITPYFLGILLGDGDIGYGQVGITTTDIEIKEEIQRQAIRWKLDLRQEEKDPNHFFLTAHRGSGRNSKGQFICNNLLSYFIKGLGLRVTCENKFIPHIYKTAGPRQRLSLLAGLIDADGSYSTGTYDYISKSEQLANDVAFLSRSVGLAAYVSSSIKRSQNGTKGEYFRVSISGYCSIIPCRIPYKKSSIRRQKKDVLVTGLQIEELDFNTYYGFTINGDGRYLLDDFTVTHNSGKTVIGASFILLSHGPITYLCSSKMLQDQIEEDFVEAALLKGRANYLCPYLQDQVQYRTTNSTITADDCVGQKRCPQDFRDKCPYQLQKKYVEKAEFKVLNYQYFVSECQTPKSVFSGLSPWVICDEADLLDTILVNMISFVITRKAMDRYKLPLPDAKTKLWAYHEWVIEAFEVLKPRYLGLDSKLEGYTKDYPPPIELVREHKRAKNLLAKLSFLCREIDPNWVAEWDEDKLTFKPVWLTPVLVQRFFMQHVPRLLLMSGTLPPKPILCGLLHFDPQDVDYLELPHTFPIRNRLVYYKPVVNMTRDTMKDPQTIRTLANEINETLNHFPGRGVIGTVSYNLAKALARTIPEPTSRRLLIHNSQNKDEVLQEYFRTPGAVLLSPSCERGLDLKGDLGTFFGWAKCPFLSLADKQTAARAYGSGDWGKLWYRSMAAMTIEQGSGRTTRTPTDVGVTFLWDEQIGKLLRETSLWHRWFLDSLVRGSAF